MFSLKLKTIQTGMMTLLGALMLSSMAVQAQDEVPAEPTKKQSRFEIRFLNELIRSHTSVINLAALADERTSEQSILDLAHNRADLSNNDLPTLQDWQTTWYGDQTTSSSNRGRSSAARLRGLSKSSGDRFERQFLQRLLSEDLRLLALLKQVPKQAFHQELIDYSANLQATLEAEVQTIRDLLADKSLFKNGSDVSDGSASMDDTTT